MARQISDEEYQFLQNRRQVADFVESIYNDPQYAKEAKRLIKKKYPNLQIPDYDVEEAVNLRLDHEKRERDDAEAKKRADEEEKTWKQSREETQKKYKFTDEAMGRLEKLMKDRYIGDYEVAASYFAAQEPQAAEPTYDGLWHHDKTEGFAEIAKDPESWGRSELLRAFRGEEQRLKSSR
jgi:hypothetical protein